MNYQSIQRLLSKLTYISDTGHFVWKATGKLAGSFDKAGYKQLSVGSGDDRVRVYAHHMAWFLVHGFWPTKTIDHINGVKHDNRPHNLRHVHQNVNKQNIVRPFSNNKSGFLGVSFCEKRGVYYANISYKGKKKYLGTFKCPQQAHEAYLAFKRKNHAGCTL